MEVKKKMSEDLYKMKCPHCGKRLMYKVVGISPTEVLRAKKGILGFGAGPLQSNSRQNEMFRNRKILLDFINEEGLKGREYIGYIAYDGIPFNGVLMFRVPIGEEEIKAKEIEEISAKPIEESQEKLFKVLRKNRAKKPKREEHGIPKPRVPKTKKGEDIPREELAEMFESELERHRSRSPGEDEPEWKKAEDELMMESLKKEKEEDKKTDTSAIPKKENPEKKKHETISKEELHKKFEEETGKNAVWQGKETKNFQEWMENYMRIRSAGLL